MHIYLLIHTINSPTSKRKLEKHLSSLTNILSFEVENKCCTYEIQTNIRKKDFIKLLGSFVKTLSLNIDERVVLYDTNILHSIIEKPNHKRDACGSEKIILNGDIEKENRSDSYRIEEIIIEMFKYINFRKVLEEVHKGYFDKML